MGWTSWFVPSVPVIELVVRGSTTYLLLYALMRVLGRRESASVNLSDVLVVVLIADAASTGMMGKASTIGDGMVMVCTVLAWSTVLDALAYRFEWFRRIVDASPEPLIKDGRLVRRTMRRQLLTREEVMTQLRLQGIEDLEQVSRAYLEPNGSISVLSRLDDEDAAGLGKDVRDAD